MICYMLAVALCVSGLILNTDPASASSGGFISAGGKIPLVDIVLWSLIVVLTVGIATASGVIAYQDHRRAIEASKPIRPKIPGRNNS